MSDDRKAHQGNQLQCNVIVVMYNSCATISQLSRGLARNRQWIAQIALVDNGSLDESARVARERFALEELPADVISGTNTGFAGGHWAARGAFLDPTLPTLCVNPDVELAEGIVGTLLRVYASHTLPVGVLTAPLVGMDGQEDTALRRKLPTAIGGVLYSIFGRLLPDRFRYNSGGRGETHHQVDGVIITPTEATTGALMLIAPEFRNVEDGLFDRDYFMYGEDLQLCQDAAKSGFGVYVVETETSVHIKGASSGWPRSRHSNRAFHEAMSIYYDKNLARSRLDSKVVHVAVYARFLLTAGIGAMRSYTRNRR